jgi:hypothetical protein
MQNESDSDLTSAVNYSNPVFANVVDWYKNADSKAQIILTLDGHWWRFSQHLSSRCHSKFR